MKRQQDHVWPVVRERRCFPHQFYGECDGGVHLVESGRRALEARVLVGKLALLELVHCPLGVDVRDCHEGLLAQWSPQKTIFEQLLPLVRLRRR